MEFVSTLKWHSVAHDPPAAMTDVVVTDGYHLWVAYKLPDCDGTLYGDWYGTDNRYSDVPRHWADMPELPTYDAPVDHSDRIVTMDDELRDRGMYKRDFA